MKTSLKLLILVPMVVLAGCQTTSNSPSSEKAAAAAKPDDGGKATLVIEYDESGTGMRATRYNSINNELDRFNYLEQNFEAVFRDVLSDYTFDFQLHPAEVSENANVLELTFLSLDSPSPIELELRLWVFLHQGDKKIDLGIVRSKIVPQQPMNQSSIERDLNSLYTDAGKQVLQKILPEL